MTKDWSSERFPRRMRIISDNDYCGDPDGLVQLAHHLLSPSVDMRLVIGGQVPTYDPHWSPTSACGSEAKARALTELVGRDDVRILAGSNEALVDPREPLVCEAAEAIVIEAMREDTDLPLFVTCGGSLTNVVSAWLMEPRIAERLTLVWIGGPEYDDMATPPPNWLPIEYNTSIDIVAAQVLFSTSNLVLWQVPQNTYRQALVSRDELCVRMCPQGVLGAHLFGELERFGLEMQALGLHLGESFILGDSPLVLLTALQSTFSPSPSSSGWVDRPRNHLLDTGHYDDTTQGAPVRIYTHLDTRLLFEDLYAKLAVHGTSESG